MLCYRIVWEPSNVSVARFFGLVFFFSVHKIKLRIKKFHRNRATDTFPMTQLKCSSFANKMLEYAITPKGSVFRLCHTSATEPFVPAHWTENPIQCTWAQSQRGKDCINVWLLLPDNAAVRHSNWYWWIQQSQICDSDYKILFLLLIRERDYAI